MGDRLTTDLGDNGHQVSKDVVATCAVRAWSTRSLPNGLARLCNCPPFRQLQATNQPHKYIKSSKGQTVRENWVWTRLLRPSQVTLPGDLPSDLQVWKKQR